MWVCSRCHVLQGIEVWVDDDVLKSRCVNCGIPHDINDVHFIDKDLSSEVIRRVEQKVPDYLHNFVRYSWVSNKTVGLVFEFPIDELAENMDEDPLFYFQDDLGDDLGINITVYFE